MSTFDPARLRICADCGAWVDPGASRCPQGHEGVWDLGDVLGSESSTMDRGEPALPRRSPRRPIGNTVFECQRCARLVETQEFQGRSVVPRFCPWCGRPVLSLLGRELDGYRIDEALAAGGFGHVYLASNVAQPLMKAVVKVLRPAVGYSRPELIRVFVEEARLTEAIGQTCWNIVRVSNVREKPWPFFFMEYVRGRNLDEIIVESLPRRLPLRDATAYLRGIARALEATHARRRVHRDLKPQNVMVIEEGEIALSEDRVKIVDFGLAMRLPGGGSRFASADIEAMIGEAKDSPILAAGTPEYMAPEAFAGACDVSTDLYAFGVTAFEIITGRRPWKDPDGGWPRGDYWRRCHREEPPIPLRSLRPEAPRWLARIVERCLEKDPARRIQSAAELLRRLRLPLPRWVWAASAAAVVLVGFLVYRTVLGSIEQRFDAPLEVHVPRLEALAGREVEVAVPGGQEAAELAWTSTPPGLAFTPAAAGKLRLWFPSGSEAAAAAGAPLRFEGRAGGLLRRGVHVTGELRVVVDADAPRVAKGFQCLRASRDDAERLPPEMRLRRAVRLAIEVEEEHLAAAVLKVARRGEARELRSIDGERAASGAPGRVVFPLAALEPGEYTVRAAARDRAGNEALGETAGVVIDERVELTPLGREPLVADGRALYRCRFGEPLGAIAVREKDSGAPHPVEYFAAAGIETPLDLARFLATGPAPLRFQDLKPGTTYYLAVACSAAGGPKLEVLARDLTFAPPNETEPAWDLEFTAPQALGPNDLGALTLTPGAAGIPRVVPAGSWSVTGISFIAAGEALGRVRVDELRLGVRQGRVLGASLELEGESLPGDVSADAVSFRGFALPADRATSLTLRLVDPLRRPLEAPLALRPDTRDPDFQLRILPEAVSSPPYPPYHDVAAGAKLAIELHGASEPLLRVRAQIGERALEPELPPGGHDPAASAALPLGEVALAEGNHKAVVEAWDLAGRRQARALDIAVNPAPPRLNAVASRAAGDLVLGAQLALVFEASDPNGVDLHRARFVARVDGDPPREIALEIRDRPDAAAAPRPVVSFQVDLAALPDRCSGRLIPSVPDACGRAQTQELPFRFERRVRFEDEVAWRGVRWIRSGEGGRELYIAATEVTNGLFGDARFFAAGAYRDPKLLADYARPKYWAEDGSLPEYERGGKVVPADGFPVTGISPEEAEAFARVVFGGRLPYWEEWLSAARQDNLIGRFPWKDEAAGRAWIHCRYGELTLSPAVRERLADRVRWGGKWYPLRPLEAGADPFPPEVKSALGSARLLHVLGNVAEIVRQRGDAARAAPYAVAGGDFDTEYERIGLDREPRPYRGDKDDRLFTVGFRVVIDPAEADADPEFLELAKKRI